MANLECKFNVSIEACINKTLAECFKQIYDDYKVAVLDVDVNWLDVSDTSESKMLVKDIKVKTFYKVD